MQHLMVKKFIFYLSLKTMKQCIMHNLQSPSPSPALPTSAFESQQKPHQQPQQRPQQQPQQ